MNQQNIAIIGDGAMATTCAMLLDHKGHRVTLWGPFIEQIEALIAERENRKFLPGIPLSPSLQFTTDEDFAMHKAQWIMAAVPSQYMRQVLKRFAGKVPAGVPIISVAKGIERKTLLRPTQVITDVLGTDTIGPLAALSGPSIAGELARRLPCTITAACEQPDIAEQIQQMFTTHWLRVYTNDDLLGVELAGATKNVIALAGGIIDGLRAGYNAKSALLCRGLSEIARLGTAMGARGETFFGISGVGDLATTCFCPAGRNRTAGELLGKGLKLDDVLNRIEGIVEGVPTTQAVLELARQHDVEMPITQAIHAVLFEELDPIDGIAQLMQRAPKAEHAG